MSLPKEVGVYISKAPTDPKDREVWSTNMVNLQIMMWISNGATCLECKHKYESINDFRDRSPKRGHTKEMSFVCAVCYPVYLTKVTGGSP